MSKAFVNLYKKYVQLLFFPSAQDDSGCNDDDDEDDDEDFVGPSLPTSTDNVCNVIFIYP